MVIKIDKNFTLLVVVHLYERYDKLQYNEYNNEEDMGRKDERYK